MQHLWSLTKIQTFLFLQNEYCDLRLIRNDCGMLDIPSPIFNNGKEKSLGQRQTCGTNFFFLQ